MLLVLFVLLMLLVLFVLLMLLVCCSADAPVLFVLLMLLVLFVLLAAVSESASQGVQFSPVSPVQPVRSQRPADVRSEPSERHDHSLVSRKVELCDALRSCIESLQREKKILSAELKAHRELGQRVDAWVQERCEEGQRDKYRLFIGDLERVVNLLLSLCGRLARVERSLEALARQEPAEGSTELWDSLAHKRSLLLRQTQDALELREHLEQRQCTVHAFLRRSLDPARLRLYQSLVSRTPALLISHRRLEDVIRQHQDS
ncbi:hypothetical protein WMY93_021084 [Mugilogobius chulae]|uniref:ASD2 domain-containing protein n=1 Tax=Mugilogobius chulae TaxID=88201 RepID=A0AAW0NJQ5_9GOBI